MPGSTIYYPKRVGVEVEVGVGIGVVLGQVTTVVEQFKRSTRAVN